MSVTDLSVSTQNYLKAIWALSEWTDEPVTPTRIADRVGLRLSSVSDAMKKLDSQGYVDRTPYGAIELTDQGRSYALAMVRRHRLLESFLVQTLDYSWDQVHDEAESLEHAVSDFMVARIDAFLGHPTRDPHGDPIPAADGSVISLDAVRLTHVDPTGTDGTDDTETSGGSVGSTTSTDRGGRSVVVERIVDQDPELLQFFADSGIVLGTRLIVRKGAPFSDTVEIQVAGTESAGAAAEFLTLGRSGTDALYVSVISD